MRRVLLVLGVSWLVGGSSTGACAAEPAADVATDQTVEALESSLKEGSALVEAGRLGEGRRVWERAAEAAAAALSKAGENRTALAEALRQAGGEEDDVSAANKLSAAMKSVAAALRFRPRMEAPLPAGFPPPGPVGEVVVKEYPAYRAARTSMAAGTGQNGAFRVLFNHIQSNRIAMTAPVEMTYRPDAGKQAPAEDPQNGRAGVGNELSPASMAFLYESPTLGRAGGDGRVEVVDLPAVTVVSIGVRGNYTAERMKRAVEVLEAWLEQRQGAYVRDGPPRYLGYNSPFNLPWNKYGEVQIPVRKKD